MSPSLRRFRGLIYLAVLLVCAWSLWQQWPQRSAAPVGWLQQWQSELFTPLAAGQLSVQTLRGVAPGGLWLAPKGEAGPRLLYRATWEHGDERWKLEAELALSDKERASVMDALDARPEQGDQLLGDNLLEQLGQHRLLSLYLKPEAETTDASLSATFGAPRARVALPAGGEAWVYPQAGLTLFFTEGRLDLLQVEPLPAKPQAEAPADVPGQPAPGA